MRRGVVVTGSGRRGTSMVAGLFAAHGVFFGDCKPADENNPRGYFEHPAIPRPKARGRGWPRTWLKRLKREGWDAMDAVLVILALSVAIVAVAGGLAEAGVL